MHNILFSNLCDAVWGYKNSACYWENKTFHADAIIKAAGVW